MQNSSAYQFFNQLVPAKEQNSFQADFATTWRCPLMASNEKMSVHNNLLKT